MNIFLSALMPWFSTIKPTGVIPNQRSVPINNNNNGRELHSGARSDGVISETINSWDEWLLLENNYSSVAWVDLKENMTFLQYFRDREPMSAAVGDIRSAAWDLHPNKPTKIIIHGWVNDWESNVGQKIKDGYLYNSTLLKYNVLLVDWSNCSRRMYERSRLCAPLAGKIVAMFVDEMVKKHKINVKDVHLIGFSMGAHVAGVAGRYIKSGKPGRVTGLDPARPLFVNSTDRIAINSADFVDVIHTCAPGLGIFEPLGDIDFYPNEGSPGQPGCFTTDIVRAGTCSHRRSYLIFVEALSYPYGFKSIKCDSWAQFRNGLCQGNHTTYIGETASKNDPRGNYYLTTGSEEGNLRKGADGLSISWRQELAKWAGRILTYDIRYI